MTERQYVLFTSKERLSCAREILRNTYFTCNEDGELRKSLQDIVRQLDKLADTSYKELMNTGHRVTEG